MVTRTRLSPGRLPCMTISGSGPHAPGQSIGGPAAVRAGGRGSAGQMATYGAGRNPKVESAACPAGPVSHARYAEDSAGRSVATTIAAA